MLTYLRLFVAGVAIVAMFFLGVYIYDSGRKSILNKLTEVSLENLRTSNSIYDKNRTKSKKDICLELSGNDLDACSGMPDE